MAKLAEILTVERDRQEREKWSKVHLYLEGTFLRAYQWSAWLCERYIGQFKATRRPIKDSDESFVFIGFPQTSLQKYVIEGVLVEQIAEKEFLLTLQDDIFPVDSVFEIISTDFENWKQSVPLSAGKNGKTGNVLSLNVDGNSDTIPRVSDILQQIMSFPLESKSPIDCMLFLGEIKQHIAKLI